MPFHLRELDLAYALVAFGYYLFSLFLPVWLFFRFRGRSRTPGRTQGALMAAIVLSWAALFAYRLWTLDIPDAYVNSFEDPTLADFVIHDGVAGNVAILMFGWFPPTLALVLTYLTRRLRSRFLLHYTKTAI